MIKKINSILFYILIVRKRKFSKYLYLVKNTYHEALRSRSIDNGLSIYFCCFYFGTRQSLLYRNRTFQSISSWRATLSRRRSPQHTIVTSQSRQYYSYLQFRVDLQPPAHDVLMERELLSSFPLRQYRRTHSSVAHGTHDFARRVSLEFSRNFVSRI